MDVPFLDLRRSIKALGPALYEAIGHVLADGRLILGPAVERFEHVFAESCGARHAVGVASGTDALTVALRAVGVAKGDEVLTTAFSTVATVAGIEAAGARPVLVDIDPSTYTVDPALLGSRLTGRTRAIVPVHLYGQCADMTAIGAFARRHSLAIVEDAAQAHGATFDSTAAGSLGDAAAFSFYPTKNLGALGDAGAVVTNDPQIAERARMLRSYGEQSRNDSVLRGWNSRLDSAQAAVLELKLAHLGAWNRRRRELATRYSDALAATGLHLPREASGRRHAWHLFVLRARRRDALAQAVLARGVETHVHYPRAIHQHTAYADLDPRDRSLARSERAAEEVMSLPLYPELTDAEADRTAEAVCAAQREIDA